MDAQDSLTIFFWMQVQTKTGLHQQGLDQSMRASCCCGATRATPCRCMVDDLACSSTKPFCPCYKLLHLQARRLSDPICKPSAHRQERGGGARATKQGKR